MTVARSLKTSDDLESIIARRTALEAELAKVLEAEALAKEAARDAGRSLLLSALEKVKIGALSRREATTIARALERLGTSGVVARLSDPETGSS